MKEHQPHTVHPAKLMNNDQKMFLMILVAALLITLVFVLWPKNAVSQQLPPRTVFAECLAKKGVTMYGEDSCPNCQDQKGMFEEDFKHIPYVDCAVNTDACTQKNIQGYPTWLYNGKSVLGIQTFQQLAELSACTPP